MSIVCVDSIDSIAAKVKEWSPGPGLANLAPSFVTQDGNAKTATVPQRS